MQVRQSPYTHPIPPSGGGGGAAAVSAPGAAAGGAEAAPKEEEKKEEPEESEEDEVCAALRRPLDLGFCRTWGSRCLTRVRCKRVQGVQGIDLRDS